MHHSVECLLLSVGSNIQRMMQLLLAPATAMWQLVWWSLYFSLFMLALLLYTSAGGMLLGMLPSEQSPLARATTGRND